MAMHDIADEGDVKRLVDTFYEKVLVDPVIGYIFTDVAAISMEHHMPVLYSFWEMVLLAKEGYKDNPMAKHKALNKLVPLTHEHFARWLLLWEGNVKEQFEGVVAEQAIARAKNIAALMEYKVQQGK